MLLLQTLSMSPGLCHRSPKPSPRRLAYLDSHSQRARGSAADRGSDVHPHFPLTINTPTYFQIPFHNWGDTRASLM